MTVKELIDLLQAYEGDGLLECNIQFLMGKSCCMRFDGCRACRKECIEWLLEEYKEPILTEEEKEYLRAVIKPFRKFVMCIKKLEASAKGMEKISLYSQDSQSWGCTTILPPFKKSTGMFQNMELDREYTLEELGL